MNMIKEWIAVAITVGLIFFGFSFTKFDYLTLKGDPFFFYMSLGMLSFAFILTTILAFKELSKQKLRQGNKS